MTAAFSVIGIIYPLVAIAGFWVSFCGVGMCPHCEDSVELWTWSWSLVFRQLPSFPKVCSHVEEQGLLATDEAATPSMQRPPSVCFAVLISLTCVSGWQAFGNQVSSLVVLSLPPQHRWAAVTSKVLLVIHAAFNYQVRSGPCTISREAFELLATSPSELLCRPSTCSSVRQPQPLGGFGTAPSWVLSVNLGL